MSEPADDLPYRAARQRLVPLADERTWTEVLSTVRHTWSHTWTHCRAVQPAEGATTCLYEWDDGRAKVVIPLVERPYRGHVDVATPPGLAGVVASSDAVHGWQEDWRVFAADQGWVCGYLQLDPVLTATASWAGVAEDEPDRDVYLLDLTADVDVLLSRMSQNRRRQLRAWQSAGARLVQDRERLLAFLVEHAPPFFRARSASRAYDLRPADWRTLLASDDVLALGAESDGQVLAAFLFGCTPVAADYLFGISAPGQEGLSAALLWAGALALKERGIPLLDLGGGVRPGDGVARFKQRFHPQVAPLRALRQVYVPAEYDALCRDAGASPDHRSGFFPPYRGAARA